MIDRNLNVDVVDGGQNQQQQQHNRVEEDIDDVGISRELASMRSVSESDHAELMGGGDGEERGSGGNSNLAGRIFKLEMSDST